MDSLTRKIAGEPTQEYKKYQARTLSEVEAAFLDSIENLKAIEKQ